MQNIGYFYIMKLNKHIMDYENEKTKALHEWIDQLDEDSIDELYFEYISNEKIEESNSAYLSQEKKSIQDTEDSLQNFR